MDMKKLLLMVLLAFSALTLSGCFWPGYGPGWRHDGGDGGHYGGDGGHYGGGGGGERPH